MKRRRRNSRRRPLRTGLRWSVAPWTCRPRCRRLIQPPTTRLFLPWNGRSRPRRYSIRSRSKPRRKFHRWMPRVPIRLQLPCHRRSHLNATDMGWLKRNLFFVIGLVIALGLLGASAFYIYSSYSRNSEDLDKLKEIYGTLSQIPAGSDKPELVDELRKQTDQVRQWIKKTHDYFQPIAPIPATDRGLTDDVFANALRRTITQLRSEADTANVALPPGYNFSFQAQSDKVRFAPAGSVEKLAVQLGEVKTISEIMFAAHVS